MFTTHTDNAVYALHAFVKQLKAKVTRHTVEATLKNHPDYPSLLSFNSALTQWRIENVAIELQPEQLSELEAPFIAHIHYQGQPEFALIQSVGNGMVEWRRDAKGLHREPLAEFTRKWTGVVLLAEATPGAGEEGYAENVKKETLHKLRLPFVIAAIAACVLTGVYYGATAGNGYWYALLTLKLVGSILGGLLIWQSIDRNNPLVMRLCRAGENSNCNAILDAPAARIWGWLSWAEIGFFYFSGDLLALLLSNGSPATAVFLAAINLLALPFTVYSVYHQGVVARQWCTLCVGIVALLWLEFLVALVFWNAFSVHSIAGPELAKLLTAFAIPTAGWALVKPMLLAAREAEAMRDDLRRFKNNPDLFENLLRQQRIMPPAEGLETIILGNPEADQVITMVTNPYCPPCGKAHADIEELLSGNHNLKCRIIFSATNQAHDRKGEAARYLLSLPEYEQADALKNWFAADHEGRATRVNAPLSRADDERAREILESHARWCAAANIESTPTIYINQHLKPELYRLTDLAHILPHLRQEHVLAD